MKDIFIIKEGKFSVLFSPTKGLLVEISESEEKIISKIIRDRNADFNELLKIIPEINAAQLIKKAEVAEDSKKEFEPDSVVLFPTLDCNLRCIYCYSKGGESKKSMDWTMADESAINLVIKNAVKNNLKKSTLYFHGGGEPTYNWEVFTAAASYFRKRAAESGILPEINLVTNGMLLQSQREWIANNVDSIQVSFDGTEDIQNFQRPTAGGGKSFDAAYDSAKLFMEKNMRIVLHATVTEMGMGRIPEIAKFICANFPNQAMHIEPVCESGRAVLNKQRFPDADRFVKGFIEAEKIASEFGVEIFYSAATPRLAEMKSSFCGISLPNFIVTPSGSVSACHEVSDKSHFGSELMIYGFFDKTSRTFNFDLEQILRLGERASQISNKCESCFARYYCGGECFVKNLKNVLCGGGTLSNQRCVINKKLTKHFIMKRFSERR